MEIGIWENVQPTSDRHNDGHLLYTANCKFCGFEMKCKLRDLGRAKICRHITNGIKDNRINKIFNGMVYRCYNENEKSYKRYGYRGIKICKQWIENPQSFEKWSIENGYNDTLTIDRIDNDGDYCPENCRWISLEENARYKSTTMIINVDGVKMTGRDWAKKLGLCHNRINIYRNKYGYENTVNFIRKAIKCGIPKLNAKESYYRKIMESE